MRLRSPSSDWAWVPLTSKQIKHTECICYRNCRLQVPKCFMERHHSRNGHQRQRAKAPPEWPADSWGDSGRWAPPDGRGGRHWEDGNQVWCLLDLLSVRPAILIRGLNTLTQSTHPSIFHFVWQVSLLMLEQEAGYTLDSSPTNQKCTCFIHSHVWTI